MSAEFTRFWIELSKVTRVTPYGALRSLSLV